MISLRVSITVEAQRGKAFNQTKHSSQTVEVKAGRYKYDENGASW